MLSETGIFDRDGGSYRVLKSFPETSQMVSVERIFLDQGSHRELRAIRI